ncbi:MAG TPA: PadR family transcriptional regulator [Bradyrhizobium sp.]|nr:PadR family transcriptional regulator [Bradyrhizobium sp.]
MSGSNIGLVMKNLEKISSHGVQDDGRAEADVFSLTASGLRIVNVFLTNPTRPWSGYQLSKEAKTGSGTLYPLLHKLEKHGWLESKWEDGEQTPGRPRKRLYTLTAAGARNAREALRDFQMTAIGRGEVAWAT